MSEAEIPGVLVKRNSSGHRVIRLHYSADPDKNPHTEAGRKWFGKATSRYIGGVNSLGWRREMEIDFKAGSGELVFPEFAQKESLLTCDPFPLIQNDGSSIYNFFGGFDWGNRNYVSFHVYAESPEQKFYSVWEYYVPGTETNVFKFAETLVEQCPYYGRLMWIAADPAMWKEDQQRLDSKTSIARMFVEDVPEKHRVTLLMPAHSRSDIGAIQKFKILMLGQETPRFQIWRTCPRQIDEFRNLKYPERTDFKNESEKILDKDNHAWDDAKYAIMSHPWAQTIEAKPKPGTYGYHRMVADVAERLADSTGRDAQGFFNDLYGDL
jgi:hypothetical protein